MRQAQPWFRTEKNAWFVEHEGKQHRLGKHPEDSPPPTRGKTGWNPPKQIRDAFDEFKKNLPTLPEPAQLTVTLLCDQFLEFSLRHNDAKTYKWYKDYLQDFCDSYGPLKVADVK